MRPLLPLPLLALATLAPALLTPQNATPYPEEAVFTASIPRTAKPVSRASPAWDAKVALEAKGLPLRAVLAAVLDQAGVSYVIDPALDATVYASVKETNLREAVGLLARVCDFEIRTDGNVWYAVRLAPKLPEADAPKGVPKLTPKSNSAKFVPADPFTDPGLAIKGRPMVGTISAQEITPGEVSKTDRQRFPVGASALAKTAAKPATKPTVAKTIIVASVPDLAKRVTTKLPKADLRAVFAAFSTQTGIGIAVDEEVPRYRVDAYLKATSLRYALNEVTKAAGLVWTVEGGMIRISKHD